MDKTYRAYLERQLQEARTEFEQAKAEAIRDLENMNQWNASDTGAAYSTRIDRVTAAGTKYRTIAEAIKAYDFFNKEEAAEAKKTCFNCKFLPISAICEGCVKPITYVHSKWEAEGSEGKILW